MFCYTTVFQAVEVFAAMRTPRERDAAGDAMSAMKILGLNPKNAARYADLVVRHPRHRTTDLLTAGLCLDSGLPLLTGRAKNFRNIEGLVVVSPGQMREGATGEELLSHLRR